MLHVCYPSYGNDDEIASQLLLTNLSWEKNTDGWQKNTTEKKREQTFTVWKFLQSF